MIDPTVLATAFIVAISFVGLVFAFAFVGQAVHGYTQGRKKGGYPVMAKTRRKLFSKDFTDAAYVKGLKDAHKKIENGGYK